MTVTRFPSPPGDHSAAKNGLEKVVIELGSESWHGHATESLWAESTAGGFVLRNVPFFAYGCSYGDVVAAEESDEGTWLVTGTVRRSGHSTYRIFVKKEAALPHAWGRLASLGCTYERATEHLYAIDVPANSDVDSVYDVLEREKAKGTWDFEEGHFGHNRRRRWSLFRR